MATARRAAEYIAEAAQKGAWLAVFPESYIPGYPDWIWRVPARASSPSAEPFFSFQRRFFEQAITLPGPEVDLLAEACREHRMTVAIGVTERPAHGGTLYNSCTNLYQILQPGSDLLFIPVVFTAPSWLHLRLFTNQRTRREDTLRAPCSLRKTLL